MQLLFLLAFISLSWAISFLIDKYFSKKNVKNEKIIRYGITVLLLIIYTVILIFLNSDNINHIPSILFTIVIISFFSLKPKHK